ncbi:MAG: hypothetical protein ACI9TF_000741, partial [Paracrocinitomix sp.]
GCRKKRQIKIGHALSSSADSPAVALWQSVVNQEAANRSTQQLMH